MTRTLRSRARLAQAGRAAVVAAAFAVGLVFGGAGGERAARAFCRTSTGGLRPDCVIGGDECCTVGKPLYWKNACVGYSLQRDASRQVSLDDAEQALTHAFTKWTGTSCPTDGSGQSRVSVDVRDLGPVSCGVVEYNKDGANQHTIVFRDDNWNHSDTNNTLALTTVTFGPDTGEIYDADMEINTAQQHVTVIDPIPADGYDFDSIVTHETGHFLGMAHSTDPRATMFAHYKQGATAMRNLTSDDVAGICTVYPPNGTRTADQGVAVPEDVCDPTPRHGFTVDCAPPPQKGGCSIAAAGPGAASAPGARDARGARDEAAAAGLVAMAIAAAGARRSRRRSAR